MGWRYINSQPHHILIYILQPDVDTEKERERYRESEREKLCFYEPTEEKETVPNTVVPRLMTIIRSSKIAVQQNRHQAKVKKPIRMH